MDTTADVDANLVENWLKRDPSRWVAGALAGIFAGLISAAFAGVLAIAGGYEFWFPLKAVATPFFGGAATEYSNSQALLVGFVAYEALCAFLGLVYAHFTATNALGPLLGMGFVWGVFSWIFISCLFAQSFRAFSALNISKGILFPIDLVFGLSLTSVAFFDKLVRPSGRR
jgi:hypothetical protein